MDGVVGFVRLEFMGLLRGKICGRNFLLRDRKVGEKEVGRDLKCFSNFKNILKYLFRR